MPSVLFVFTSTDRDLKGEPTGWYLPEAAHPYYVLAPHADIDFASPNGPNPPIDEGSVKAFAEDQLSQKFLQDETVKQKFANALKLADVQVSKYDAIFYVGGHGPVFDLALSPINAKVASEFYQAGKITSAVCHGPAALVNAQDKNGVSIFAGRRFTGFSNVEEEQVKKVDSIPFLLETKLSELGGKYEKADPWQPKVVLDGLIYTGQNPASAGPLAEEILKALKK